MITFKPFGALKITNPKVPKETLIDVSYTGQNYLSSNFLLLPNNILLSGDTAKELVKSDELSSFMIPVKDSELLSFYIQELSKVSNLQDTPLIKLTNDITCGVLGGVPNLIINDTTFILTPNQWEVLSTKLDLDYTSGSNLDEKCPFCKQPIGSTFHNEVCLELREVE